MSETETTEALKEVADEIERESEAQKGARHFKTTHLGMHRIRLRCLRTIAEIDRLKSELNAAYERAAKVADAKRDEYEEACAVEWQASNDDHSLRMGDKSDVAVEIATAIRNLKEPT
jgi:hypothetical protein